MFQRCERKSYVVLDERRHWVFHPSDGQYPISGRCVLVWPTKERQRRERRERRGYGDSDKTGRVD